MIILDTCALIYDALTPKKLSLKAKNAIEDAQKNDDLYCCGISLWEIGMLVQKKRLTPGTDTKSFLLILLQARQIKVVDIDIEIATLATADTRFQHFDPADRLIAATAISHQAGLITCDQHLKKISQLSIIW